MSDPTFQAPNSQAPNSQAPNSQAPNSQAPSSQAPPTRRGIHARLAALSTVEPVAHRPSGYRADRTMPLAVEFRRQLKRRRTRLTALFLLALPIIMALAFKLGGNPQDAQGGPALVDLATTGAGNFALFAEFASVGFLLVVLVAMFCGDTVASEASWSSLRYLLGLPIPRARLLRKKMVVALTFSFGANLVLPAWSFVVGGLFFGWAPAKSPFGATFSYPDMLARMGIVAGYACGQALIVAALAFLLSVLTDAPLAAVGGATLLVVVSNILDSITALDPYRVVLPTHFQYSWLDALTPQINADDMIRGTAVAAIYTAVFCTAAWARFGRKDITS